MKEGLPNLHQEDSSENIEEKFKDSRVRGEDGNLLKMYHFSDTAGIEKFSTDFIGRNFEGDDGFFGAGIYFTQSDDTYAYGSNRYEAYLNLKNPLIIKNPTNETIHQLKGKRDELQAEGYDGVMIWNDAIPDEIKKIFGKEQVIKGKPAQWSEICVFDGEDIFILDEGREKPAI